MRKVRIIEGKYADKGYSSCFDYIKKIAKEQRKQRRVKNNDSNLRKGVN